MICVMWIKARALTVWLNPGFDAHRMAMAVPLTRVLLPAQMFFFLGGLMMGVLYSRKQFLIPALGPVIYNSGIIFGGVVLRRWLGIEGLVWGAIAGAFLGNFLIPYLAVRRLDVHLRPNFAVLHPAAVKVWRMLLPIGLGVSLPNIDQMVNKAFASYLGAGDTTAIMNAYRLMLLPIGVFAQAMALAVYPTLSEQAGLRDLKAMRRTMSQSLRNILFLTVPSSALMFLLAVPIITFLLQSGKYTHADTLVTAGALRPSRLGIFAWSCQSLLTRGFYALQNSQIPVISGAIVSVLFVGMNWAVVHHTHWGVRGLGLATSIAAAIHMTALFVLLRGRLRGIQGDRCGVSLSARRSLATLALCLAPKVRARRPWTPCLRFRRPPTTWPPITPKVAALLTLAVAGARRPRRLPPDRPPAADGGTAGRRRHDPAQARVEWSRRVRASGYFRNRSFTHDTNRRRRMERRLEVRPRHDEDRAAAPSTAPTRSSPAWRTARAPTPKNSSARPTPAASPWPWPSPLASSGHPATRVHTTAKVQFGPADGGFAISGIDLTTEAEVPGLDDAAFQKQAQAAKEGCPVSKALAATPITLTAKLL